MIRALIVDDEEPARLLVRKFLEEFQDIEIVGECPDGFCATKCINQHKPDIIFLDVQMPKISGFEVLEIVEHKPQVIFTTAYDSYAIKAFDQNAVDYLLKPFSRDRFREAVQKVIGKVNSNDTSSFNDIMAVAEAKTDLLERVAVKSGAKIEIVAVSEISRIESEGDYVMIFSKNGKYLKDKTMKFFEQHLDPKCFVRVHRSCIINVNEISRIELFEKDSYLIKLKDGAQVKASSAGFKLLKEILNL
jgi:Response regulator of the LytR/AlgR family